MMTQTSQTSGGAGGVLARSMPKTARMRSLKASVRLLVLSKKKKYNHDTHREGYQDSRSYCSKMMFPKPSTV